MEQEKLSASREDLQSGVRVYIPTRKTSNSEKMLGEITQTLHRYKHDKPYLTLNVVRDVREYPGEVQVNFEEYSLLSRFRPEDFDLYPAESTTPAAPDAGAAEREPWPTHRLNALKQTLEALGPLPNPYDSEQAWLHNTVAEMLEDAFTVREVLAEAERRYSQALASAEAEWFKVGGLEAQLQQQTAARATAEAEAAGLREALKALVSKWGVEGIDQSNFGSEDAADAYLDCSAQLKAALATPPQMPQQAPPRTSGSGEVHAAVQHLEAARVALADDVVRQSAIDNALAALAGFAGGEVQEGGEESFCQCPFVMIMRREDDKPYCATCKLLIDE